MSKGWKEPTLPGSKVLVALELVLGLEPVLELEVTEPPPPPQDKSIAQAKIIKYFIISSQKTNKILQEKSLPKKAFFFEFSYFNLQ